MRYCWRHIPHNLIAGGGLNSYGGRYTGHPDLGGSDGAHHGEIVPEPTDACQECLRLRQMNDSEYAAWQTRAPAPRVYCPRCRHWERICDCHPVESDWHVITEGLPGEPGFRVVSTGSGRFPKAGAK